MSNFLFFAPVLTHLGLRRESKLFVGLLLLSFACVAFSPAVQAQPVEIGSGTLDNDKVVGPKWVRIDVDPLMDGDHIIRVTSDSSADIRFALFQILGNNVRIGTSSNSATLAQWTGALDTSEQYYLGVWSTSGSGSYIATIEALAELEIVSQPADQTVTEGEDASFMVAATGTGTLSYQWYLNDQAIADATADTHSVIATTTADDGNIYRVDVTDDNGTLSSDDATLTVDTPAELTIVSQPADLTVTEGEDADFAVAAAGIGTLTYQWYMNNEYINGATAATLSVISTSTTDDGSVFRVDVTDANSTLSSNDATLTVNELTLLTITSQPTGLTVNEGEDATFTVSATGSGTLTYQWFLNDQAIAGASADTYSAISTTASDDGNIYRVDITDDNGTLSSVNAILEVLEISVPVTVISLGQGTVDADKIAGPKLVTLYFDSLTGGTHTIRVTWDSDADVRFKVREADGTAISSTIRDTNPAVWSGDLEANAQYYIALWSASGIANYNAIIEATVPVSIVSQPDSRVVTQNDDVSFYVEAVGSGTLSYQWFANGSPLLGETADSLTVFAASLADSGTLYNVEVSNGLETVASDAATLTVNEPLTLGLFSQVADTSAWMLEGPAPTLDFNAGLNTDAWGKALLRVGDMLLVGGDFEGIKPSRPASPMDRPFLAALDAVSGQPMSTFQVPDEVDSVVRALAISPNGEQVYVGGDFGLLALDVDTGALDFAVSVTKSNNAGRVFDIAVSDTQLYIGGDFNRVDNVYRANIARLSLDGDLDPQWSPQVTSGYNSGRAAPVQSLALSSSGDIVYVGGNFRFISDVPVLTTAQGSRISLLPVSALDGSVLPERFEADIGNNVKGLTAHDIVVTEFYVIIAWGGPNYVSFHSFDGTRLQQYRAKGDVQSLQVVGDHVFVGHHGEFFGTLVNPNPPEAVVSLNPEIIAPFKIHSFRIDDPSFLPEQSWQITGAYGVWGIAAAEDSLWVAGQIWLAGSNDRPVDGLVRFPALD